MDWFTRLTGFRETSYSETQARLEVDGSTLRSTVNGKSYGIGQFEMPSLGELRQQVAAGSGQAGRLRVSIVTGDVRQMHQRPEFAGALFQVASQFNFLEMVGPSVSPEDGVTRYEHDHTQGPACAMARSESAGSPSCSTQPSAKAVACQNASNTRKALSSAAWPVFINRLARRPAKSF